MVKRGFKLIALMMMVSFLGSGYMIASERGAFPAIGVGARALSMGGAFVALADDADAIYWNPAGLVQVQSRQLASTQSDLFGMGINYNWLGFVQPLESKMAMGVAWNNLDASQAFGSFPYKEGKYLLSFGKQVSFPKSKRDFLLGLNLKYIFFAGGDGDLNIKESGLGFDAGVLFRVNSKLNLGLVARDLLTNLTGKVREDGDERKSKNSLLPDLTVGIAWHEPKTVFTFDLSEICNSLKIRTGVEYRVTNSLRLRAGYGAGSYSGGIGLSSGFYTADYSYIIHAAGDAQRISIGLKF